MKETKKKQEGNFLTQTKLHVLLLLGIVIIGIFFRFYNAQNRYPLGDESIRDAVVAFEGARQFQFPLTGPFSSAGPFTFGPWYWYHLILSEIVLPIDYAPWVLLGILSTLTILVYYGIGKELLSKNFGLLLAFFVSLSPSHIISSVGLTNPNALHLYVALSIYLFIIAIKRLLSPWLYFTFGLVLGIGANMHYQMLPLFLLPLLAIFFKKEEKGSFILYSFLGIALAFLPLFFFDANNNWYTLRNFIDYSLLNKREISIPYRWLFYIRDFWPNFVTEVIGIPKMLSVLLLIFSSISMLYYLKQKKIQYYYYPLFIIFFVIFIYLRYYDREKFFGYLHFLHPFLFIFLFTPIYLFIQKWRYKSVITGVLIVLFSFFILPRNIGELRDNLLNIEAKKSASLLQKEYTGNIALYKCATDSSEPYVSIVSSTMYVLRMQERDDTPKTKLAFLSKKCQTKNTQVIFQRPNKQYATMLLKDVSDISALSATDIAKAGYSNQSFAKKYNDSAKWWYTEKP